MPLARTLGLHVDRRRSVQVQPQFGLRARAFDTRTTVSVAASHECFVPLLEDSAAKVSDMAALTIAVAASIHSPPKSLADDHEILVVALLNLPLSVRVDFSP